MRSQRKWLVPLFITILVVSPNSEAVAQIAFADSLDWMLNDCAIAVKGRIVNVSKIGKPDSKQFEVLTVEATKVFRGNKRDRYTFIMHNYNGSDIAYRWQRNHLEMIFFLKHVSDLDDAPAPFAGYKHFLRDDGNCQSCVLLGKSKFYWPMDSPAITRDGRILNKSSEIVDYLANIPIIPEDTLKQIRIEAPANSDAYLRLYSRSAVYIYVPGRIDQSERGLRSGNHNNRDTGN